MKQLLTRLDDDLHDRLKRQAMSRGQSVNAYVGEVLLRAVSEQDDRQLTTHRAENAGLLWEPPPVNRPADDELAQATRRTGRAVSQALEAERAQR